MNVSCIFITCQKVS